MDLNVIASGGSVPSWSLNPQIHLPKPKMNPMQFQFLKDRLAEGDQFEDLTFEPEDDAVELEYSYRHYEIREKARKEFVSLVDEFGIEYITRFREVYFSRQFTFFAMENLHAELTRPDPQNALDSLADMAKNFQLAQTLWLDWHKAEELSNIHSGNH